MITKINDNTYKEERSVEITHNLEQIKGEIDFYEKEIFKFQERKKELEDLLNNLKKVK